MPDFTFRPESERQSERLAALARANERSIAYEMRAAVGVYLDLMDLARLREETKINSTRLKPQERDEVERRIKDDLGRVLLAAVSDDAHSIFENEANVEYPMGRMGHIVTPFEKVIDWIVTGNVRE